MARNTPDPARADQHDAAAERAARQVLLDRGAAGLAPRPWQRPPVPPSAVDLVLDHLWRAGQGTADQAATTAALRLLTAARAEVDQLETAVLFTARSQGMTWSQIAAALGLGSPQAAQQRFDRLGHRVGDA